ncbi:MAG TPA: GTPase Era [Acidimicrobiales bacterium]|jgi:GTP-binding protein Era|nr:GTPase Era [Acidimicrobiales bacterium]
MRSGFVALLGRPNVGKSTLLNHVLGQKVSITSSRPQTTRTRVHGVLTLPAHPGVGDDVQIVFVDTPGIHKPKTALGERLNATAAGAATDVDVVCLMIDATAPFGRGDEHVARQVPPDGIVVINKIDRASNEELVRQLTAVAALDRSAYFPVSARTGEGVDALVEELARRMPEGPPYYPDDMVTDQPDAVWVAELVREQLFRTLREEMPYSIATRVTELDWPHITCEILVERESQKGMVIGKGGRVLKEVGTRVRAQLRDGIFLELKVRVDKNWQRRPETFDELGY